MSKLHKSKQLLKEEVLKRLHKYIEYMLLETNLYDDLEDSGDPLSLIYQDVRDCTPTERKQWLEEF
jgi:hypothetical protein